MTKIVKGKPETNLCKAGLGFKLFYHTSNFKYTFGRLFLRHLLLAILANGHSFAKLKLRIILISHIFSLA